MKILAGSVKKYPISSPGENGRSTHKKKEPVSPLVMPGRSRAAVQP
jgi:hypothetical protein